MCFVYEIFGFEGGDSMDEKTNQPSRKLPRLRNFDYSSNAYYFVTICAYQRRALFSHIFPLSDGLSVQNELTEMGRIAQTQLLELPERFDSIVIDKYVVMPNHIHAIIAIQNGLNGVACSLSDVLCAFKSITTKECRKIGVTGAVFQKSFHDHIIRGENDYSEIWAYIEANPMNWKKDCFFADI